MADKNVNFTLIASDNTRSAFASVQKGLSGLQSSAASLRNSLAGLGVGLSVGAFAAIAKKSIDAADALNDLSARTLVSVKDLASLQLVAEQNGTSLDLVAKGVQRLSLSFGQAQGGNKAIAESLKTLGVNSSDARERLFQLADAYAKTGGDTRTLADLQKVLGKSYTELIPLLQQGGDELRNAAQASETFAQTMARLAPDADKFNDQLAAIKQNVAGVAAQLATALLPSLNQYLGAMREILSTGTLLDKIKFFTVGYINADVTDKVTDYATRTAQLRAEIDRLKKSGEDAGPVIDRLNKLIAAEVTKQQRPPPRKLLDTAVPVIRSTTSAKVNLDTIDPFVSQRTAALKELEQEQRRISDFYIQQIEEENEAIFEQSEAWINEGKAIKESVLTPLELFENRLEYINELFRLGVIDVETYGKATADAFDNVGKDTKKMTDEMNNFAKTAAKNIQNAFADFLFDPFDNGLKGMLKSFSTMIQRMIAEAAAAELTKKLFGNLVPGGEGKGLAGGFIDAIGEFFNFANGGIMTGAGSIPLNKYASGGVAYSPQLAIFGEGRTPEAYVPLPDGRRIPVKMEDAGSQSIVNNFIIQGRPDTRTQSQIAMQANRAQRRASGRFG